LTKKGGINMSDNDFDKVKDIMPNYSSFLIRRLEEIWQAWDNGNLEESLRRALRLVVFLPKKLKKKLGEEKKTITKDLNAAYRVQGVDWYTRQQNRNREARRVAMLFLEPFVNEMTDWLDERGYFERASRRLQASDFKKLESE